MGLMKVWICSFQVNFIDVLILIALGWMLLDHTDDDSTLVLVMAWCCKAEIRNLNHCWPRYDQEFNIGLVLATAVKCFFVTIE